MTSSTMNNDEVVISFFFFDRAEGHALRLPLQEMESYIRKKDIVQALIRAGKAEYILRVDDMKASRENEEDNVADQQSNTTTTRVRIASTSAGS